jgi:hypothetical protein
VRAEGAVTDWLGRVGDLTAEHRAARAADLRARRVKRRAELCDAGQDLNAIQRSSRWFKDRVRGQVTRIECVRACGGKVLRISCRACGLAHDIVAGCGVRLLCPDCRALTLARTRAAFRRARVAVLIAARARGLLRSLRRGGRFCEKFLTLTAPHVAGDTIAGRIDRMFEAWGYFLKRLNTHFRERCIRSAEWFRAFEWTFGNSDGVGHPHIHVWIFSLFLPPDLIRDWWSRSLIEAGCPPHLATRPIVDIRAVHGRDGGARELIKYLTKDITRTGDTVAAEVYAEVYKALDTRRALQASRGFMGRAKREQSVCACGARLPKQVRSIPAGAPPETAAVPDSSEPKSQPRKP